MQIGIIGAVLAVIVAGGVFLFEGYANESAEKEATEKQAMMQKETMDKEAMIKDDAMKEDTIVKDDVMMKADSMKKEDAVMKEESMIEKNAMMGHGGTYEAYNPEMMTWAKDGKVVLFFRASWCPTCRSVDADIKKNLASIPKNVTILDVDYDTETALKAKYGVTYQHTFVQVDATGKQIAKWSGSPTLASLVSEVK